MTCCDFEGDDTSADLYGMYRENMPILSECIELLYENVRYKKATVEDIQALCLCVQTMLNVAEMQEKHVGDL